MVREDRRFEGCRRVVIAMLFGVSFSLLLGTEMSIIGSKVGIVLCWNVLLLRCIFSSRYRSISNSSDP